MAVEVGPLFCVCKTPYDANGPSIVECHVCLDWFHYGCVGYEECTGDFKCPECLSACSRILIISEISLYQYCILYVIVYYM